MIKVLKKGLYTSIQDLGRPHLQPMGVPQAGAMDREAAWIANRVLGNQDRDAVLEITLLGPVLEFNEPTWIALSGGDFDFFIDDQPQAYRVPIRISKGQKLSWGKINSGSRVYLAVKGGLLSEEILGSRSYCPSITSQLTLQEGMEIPYTPSTEIPISKPYPSSKKWDGTLEAYAGPEFNLLKHQQHYQIESFEFTVSHLNNRMAYQIDPKIASHSLDQITVPVLAGTVQLTPQGTLIILMRDGQTTGGYPRVLQLTKKSVNHLAQLTTANRFKFKIITKF